jgi:uncharacterized protein YbaP (TraB family)
MRSFVRFFALAALLLAAPLLMPGCAPRAEAEGPAIWKLKDSDSEIWLFGTVHLLPPDLKWQSRKIDKAFDAAQTIYFETETDESAQKAIGDLVKKLGSNPPGVKLSSLLDTADKALLAEVCQRVKLTPAVFEDERPWLAAVQLSVAFVMTQGLAQSAGVEHVLGERAIQQNKKVSYFETTEEQIRFFADLPRPIELEFLRSTLREIKSESENVDEMNKAWARGDVKTLGAYFSDMSTEAGPEIYDALIRKRNERWATSIDKMMHGSGKIFIAVGAAHLIGNDSVVAMLRAKGYKVEGP